jgi:DNA polymerase elongation subunit (family B)
MKVLLLDIETAPHKVFTWGLFNQNVSLNQIQESGYTLSWSAKWYGDHNVMFSSIHKDGKQLMLEKIYALVEEADVIVHYNGTKFDVPTLNKEWMGMGWGPPATFNEVDLYRVVRNRFRLASNKLSYIAEYLDLGAKVNHKGMELWIECMDGVPEAWQVMEEYNKQDVVLLEKLYDAILPWIHNHPNHALFDEREVQVCPNCGGLHLQKRGFHYTKTMRYQRLRCNACGTWSRTKTSDMTKEKKAVVLSGIK